ncbi:hypothetical protein AVEN_236943-1 [Araneus ventricosus]|uniref:Uncharacterized protein n=1 Tax=Araneus ventricosus TaxID=182803 RepID=A0A4Y2LIU6_ARAVE|nr:hypothetical protein AVEN_236943-1 [Araneus ventricosus]
MAKFGSCANKPQTNDSINKRRPAVYAGLVLATPVWVSLIWREREGMSAQIPKLSLIITSPQLEAVHRQYDLIPWSRRRYVQSKENSADIGSRVCVRTIFLTVTWGGRALLGYHHQKLTGRNNQL